MDDQKLQLLNYIKGLVKQEAALRRKYEIGDHYRAVANQFKAMLAYTEESLDFSEEELDKLAQTKDVLGPNQQFVYVYLFNARGKMMSRWANILSPRNLVEYSVNRPIYAEEAQVKAYIRSRPQSDEHAYIIVKVEKTGVLAEQQSDVLGQPLLKLKEKALQIENLVTFIYKDEGYQLIGGQLLPIQSST